MSTKPGKPGDLEGGDSISASKFLNPVKRAAFRSVGIGSNTFGQFGPDQTSLGIPTPWAQREVEISDLNENDDDADNSARYLCRVRFWNNVDEVWKSQEKEWKLDCLDLGNQLFVGARLTAYWNPMRKRFIPTEPGIGCAMLTETLVRCGTAKAKVLNPDCDELQEITVKDFVDILAGDWREQLLPDTMVYFRPVGYAALDDAGDLEGRSAGSTGQYEIIAAGGNCCEDQSSSSSSSESSESSKSSLSSESSSESSNSSMSSESSSPSSESSESSCGDGFVGTREVLIGCPAMDGELLVFERELWRFSAGRLCQVTAMDDCEVDICNPCDDSSSSSSLGSSAP